MYADDMVDIYGVDAVRYCLISMMPYDNDGVIGWDQVTELINGELANVFGNPRQPHRRNDQQIFRRRGV